MRSGKNPEEILRARARARGAGETEGSRGNAGVHFLAEDISAAIVHVQNVAGNAVRAWGSDWFRTAAEAQWAWRVARVPTEREATADGAEMRW